MTENQQPFEEGTLLPVSEQPEVDALPIINCAGFVKGQPCDRQFNITVNGYNTYVNKWESTWAELAATITCDKCLQKTPFAARHGGVTELPPPLLGLLTELPEQAASTLREALAAFYGRANRAASGMARAAVDESLVEQGITDEIAYNLASKLEKAVEWKIFDKTVLPYAQGNKLIGDGALHRARRVSPAECSAAIQTAYELCMTIAAWTPPALQPGTGSNAP